MQLSYLHFKHPNILRTSDELLRSKFFVQTPEKNSTAKVHPKCIKCRGIWNANTRIAFLFADAFWAFPAILMRIVNTLQQRSLHPEFSTAECMIPNILKISYFLFLNLQQEGLVLNIVRPRFLWLRENIIWRKMISLSHADIYNSSFALWEGNSFKCSSQHRSKPIQSNPLFHTWTPLQISVNDVLFQKVLIILNFTCITRLPSIYHTLSFYFQVRNA